MKFRVAVLNDSIHTQCFAEVADSIEWALKELGHEVERAGKAYLGPEKIVNILFGVRPGEWSYLKPDTVIYNGEQATPASLWGALVDTYKRFTIWDYSPINAKRYASFGLRAPQVVRPGYCPLLEGRVPNLAKTHDIVFFGSKNERRQKLLDDLAAAGMSVLEVPFGLYGTERDEYLARARIAVNVHYYEDSIFESVRCSYLMHNDIAVVTERSADSEELLWSQRSANYDDLVAECRRLVDASAENFDIAQLAQWDAVREVSLLDDVRAALEVMVKQELASIDSEPAIEVHERPLLTLSMIVKDEKDVIERCLASVKPHISHWAIVDTGSTDGTQEIIREFMKDIPGELAERPWKEFDGSRTEAIELAQKVCGSEGWLLLIDSDEVLIVDGPLVIPDSWDAYLGNVTRCLGCNTWGRPVFARANKSWFYEMPRHEGLYSRGHAPASHTPIPNVTILSTIEGARAKEGMYERFLRDAQVLEKWLQSHPGHARAQYYIGQSYRDAATGKVPLDKAAMQRAVQAYSKRSDMAGFDQETFSAMFQAARAMNACGYPWATVQHALLRAFAFRPTRPEPLEDIALYYLGEKQWALAELFARKAASLPMSTDAYPDVDQSVHLWLAKDTLATALTYLNGHAEALVLFEEILPLVPGSDHQERVLANIAMCRNHLGLTALNMRVL